MIKRSAVHATFTVERSYAHGPARVFQAFADPRAKARWFSPPAGWDCKRGKMAFQVGGKEHLVSTPPDGKGHAFDATYLDIVPDERIVYVYEMHIGEAKISASLATIEFRPEGKGTKLVITEQGVFLDGYDDAGSREKGTQFLMEQIGATLETAD